MTASNKASSNNRRFVLIDQTLENFQGHHFEYASAVAQAAVQAGFGCEVWARKNCSKDISIPNTQLIPAFSLDWTGAANSQRSFESLKNLITRKFNETQAGAQAYRLLRRGYRKFKKNRQAATVFGLELRKQMAASRLQPSDLVFIPTLSVEEADECVSVVLESNSCPTFHLLFRRDPDETSVAQGLAGLLHRLSTLPLEKRSLIRLYTDTEELSRAYSERSSTKFETLPIPIQKTRFAGIQSRPSDSSRIRIAYLGDARSEKGFHQLPRIVQSISALAGTPRLVVTVQAAPIQDEEGAVRKARQALKRFSSETVTLLDRPLNPAEYIALLNEADAILLPYQPGTYRYRSSGILAEALAAGRPCIVPAGSWMSRQISDGTGLSYDGEQDLIAQLDRLRKEIDPMKARCRDRSEAWLAHHSPENLVRTLSS